MSKDDKILRTAGKRGKTKAQIATAIGTGHSYASRRVNALVDAGRLTVVGQVKPAGGVGRPSPRYARNDSA